MVEALGVVAVAPVIPLSSDASDVCVLSSSICCGHLLGMNADAVIYAKLQA